MNTRPTLLAAAILAVATPPALPDDDGFWTLRFHGAMLESSTSETRVDQGLTNRIDLGAGLGVGAEYRVSARVGVELSVLAAAVEFRSSVSNLGTEAVELTMTPVTLAVPFHLSRGERADFFVAPTLSLVRYSGIEASIDRAGLQSRVGSESDTAPGVQLGIDIPFGDRWAFSAGVRYLDTGTGNTDVDPVILTLGAAYRF